MVHFNLFRNKTFLFVKTESWNIQQLFDFLKTHKISANLDNSLLPIQKIHLMFVWMNWKFAKFHEIQNQRDAENFSFLCWQIKKYYIFLKKNWSLPCTMNSSYFSQKMATWCPNFPHPRLSSIYGFALGDIRLLFRKQKPEL